MIGFVYLWRDRMRRMFYLGSHCGTENDGYIGSNIRLKRSYKRRPQDFKRRILQRVVTGSVNDVRIAETRWLSFIKEEELSIKYYNMKLSAQGFDSISGRRAQEIGARNKDEFGRVVSGVKAAEAAHRQKDRLGRSVAAVKGAKAIHLVKNEEGKSLKASLGAKRKWKRMSGSHWWHTPEKITYFSAEPRSLSDLPGRGGIGTMPSGGWS